MWLLIFICTFHILILVKTMNNEFGFSFFLVDDKKENFSCSSAKLFFDDDDDDDDCSLLSLCMFICCECHHLHPNHPGLHDDHLIDEHFNLFRLKMDIKSMVIKRERLMCSVKLFRLSF